MEPVQSTSKCATANSFETKNSKDKPDRNDKMVKTEKRSDSSSSGSPVEENNPLVLQKNPLLISTIFLTIIDYIQPNVDKLKLFRLVCHDWYRFTLAKWRSRAVLKIIPDSVHLRKESCDGMSYQQYFNNVENANSFYQLKEKPYKRYKCKNLTMDISVYDKEADSKLFWEMIGAHAQYIHIEMCTIKDDAGGTKPLLQLLTRMLPNVKHLALTDVNDLENPWPYERLGKSDMDHILNNRTIFQKCQANLTALTLQGDIRVQLEILLLLTPNLTCITAMAGPSENIHNVDVMRKIENAMAIQKARCKNTQLEQEFALLSNLKHLDVMDTSVFHNRPKPPMIVERLLECNLKLETFAATLKDGWAGEPHRGLRGQPRTNIEQFLGNMSSTLQMLKLFRLPAYDPFDRFLGSTQMSALREIQFYGNVAFSFHFLKNTPNLEVLYINLGCFEKRHKIQQIIRVDHYSASGFRMAAPTSENDLLGTVVPKLHTLHIDHAMSVNSLTLVAKWMPNLKCLKTILMENTVSVVCELWENLTELVCLHGSRIENYHIECSDKPGSSSTTRSTTIADLKKLERFQLNSFCEESKLSDACVVNGLLKMASLEYVQICVSKKMSSKAEEMLKRRFDFNCRVIRNYTGGDHSNYDCCERVRFKLNCTDGFIRYSVQRANFRPFRWN